MQDLKVGDLVRDSLNEGRGNYGLGVIVKTDVPPPGDPEGSSTARSIAILTAKRYDVYFNKFERIITFHGEYLERV